MPSAPVLSNVTANPPSPTYLTSTTISGSMNMVGTVSLYSDINCSASLATNISSAAFSSTGALINVTANATTSIYSKSTAGDGTQSLCTKIMDFVNNTTAPTVTFQGPSAIQTKNGNVTDKMDQVFKRSQPLFIRNLEFQYRCLLFDDAHDAFPVWAVTHLVEGTGVTREIHVVPGPGGWVAMFVSPCGYGYQCFSGLQRQQSIDFFAGTVGELRLGDARYDLVSL